MLLLKFIESDNKVEVFRVLDGYIKETIPNFDEFDIINKAYIYLAFVFYNIRGTVQYQNPKLGEQEVPITVFLDNIENAYNKELYIEVDINDKLSLGCSYPTTFLIEDNNIVIDYASGIKEAKMNGQTYIIEPEERQQLVQQLGTKNISILTDIMSEHIKLVADVLEGIQFNDMSFNIVSSEIISLVLMIIKMPLEDFYNEIYVMSHYIKVSRTDFLNMTPLESQMVFKKFIKDKEEQNKREQEATGGLKTPNGR